MTSKDKKDASNKSGCGRVNVFHETDLTHSYTLECNYAGGKKINYLSPKINKNTGKLESEIPVTDTGSAMY
jgi:hypothetical protein